MWTLLDRSGISSVLFNASDAQYGDADKLIVSRAENAVKITRFSIKKDETGLQTKKN
jgi:hypothetical protein